MTDKHCTVSSKCCGCGACIAACPASAIQLKENKEGFYCAVIETARCLHCDVCHRLCPSNSQKQPPSELKGRHLKLFAAKHNDTQIRLRSSSGGVFYALATRFIQKGGIVFGATWDAEARCVSHIEVDNIASLYKLQGSKYTQSYIGDILGRVKQHLQQGRDVLFVGTPCQNAGLRAILPQKLRLHLTQVDVICHGVSSPGLLKRLLNEAYPQIPLLSVAFRDKQDGWRRFALTVSATKENRLLSRKVLKDSPFLLGFLNNLTLSRACAGCHSEWKLRSDLTLGDYWNIPAVDPAFSDDIGVSAVIASTQRGLTLLYEIKDLIQLRETSLIAFFQSNRNIIFPSVKHLRRNSFFHAYCHGKGEVCSLLQKYAP
ncbi:MAG: Coenzyme F420 hydrogenase/dehydrogenase, beta subunit C-terminal domain, partial [Candidatus Spyradenecus sp.]